METDTKTATLRCPVARAGRGKRCKIWARFRLSERVCSFRAAQAGERASGRAGTALTKELKKWEEKGKENNSKTV